MLYNSSESFSGSVMSDSLWPHGQASLSMEFSRQEYWSVGSLSFLQRIFPDPGIESKSLILQVDSLLSKLPEKPV